jgi:small subunit ribosomal protein S6
VRRDYELGIIINPEVSEEQARAILERVEQIATNHDGQVVRVNQWGRRRLAYPIEHHRDGLYMFIDMSLTPETVFELDRTLKVSEEVLRHLIKRRDPKAVQKEREARAASEAAKAQAPGGTATETEEQVTPDRVPAGFSEEAEEELPAPVGEESEIPSALSDEDIAYVPPAIEDEETIEA